MKPTIRFFLAAVPFFLAGYLVAWTLHASDWKVWLSKLEGKPIETWNWCPLDVIEVTSFSTKRAITDPDDLKKLCAARIDETLVADAANARFEAAFRARSRSGQLTFLEYEPGGDRFRVDGRIFVSRQVQRNLETYR